MIVALAIVNAFVVATGESNSCTGSILCCGLAQSDCDGFARSVRSSLVVDTSLAAPSVLRTLRVIRAGLLIMCLV